MRRTALALLVLIVVVLAFYSYERYKRPPGQTAIGQLSPRNLYIITASGLRADRLSSYLYQPVQTPAIDFLGYDGVRFTNAYTPSTEGLSAHLSILTGIYPFRDSIKQFTDSLQGTGSPRTSEDVSMLSDLLMRNGYRTAAFLSDPELRVPAFFGKYFHQTFTGDHELYPWQSAYSPASACRLAREWIHQNRATPHFVLLNFHEPAFPFDPPAPYNKQYTREPYDGEVAGLDEQVGLLIDLLKDTGLFQKSVIIFTSPYGETLAGTSRYDAPDNSMLRVPLIVTAPGLLPRKQNYEAQVSLIDLMPTALELLEYSNPSKMDGLPLFQKGDSAQISREFILGIVPFANFLGFAPVYFVRNDGFLYLSGETEEITPHRFTATRTEKEREEAALQARSILRKEGVRMSDGTSETIETDPALLLEKAIHLAREQRPEIALDLLEVFSNQLPQTPYLESLTGMLALASQDPETALAFLRNAAEAAPTSRTLGMLARAALAAEEPQQALTALRRYGEGSQQMSYDDRSTYAIALMRVNREEEALIEFGTVLKQNPRYAEAYFHRGILRKKLGRLQDAESDLRKAIETKRDYAPAYREIALLLEERGKPADAVPYLRQLLKFEPENYEAMLQLALLHQKAGKPAEARKLLQSVILHSGNDQLKARAKKQMSAL